MLVAVVGASEVGISGACPGCVCGGDGGFPQTRRSYVSSRGSSGDAPGSNDGGEGHHLYILRGVGLVPGLSVLPVDK